MDKFGYIRSKDKQLKFSILHNTIKMRLNDLKKKQTTCFVVSQIKHSVDLRLINYNLVHFA